MINMFLRNDMTKKDINSSAQSQFNRSHFHWKAFAQSLSFICRYRSFSEQSPAVDCIMVVLQYSCHILHHLVETHISHLVNVF